MNAPKPRAKKFVSLLVCFSVVACGLVSPHGKTFAQETKKMHQADETLTAGKMIHGFRTVAAYLDDADAQLGGRFVHERTGFTLDVLRIQSVPQSYLWVNSFPTSNMGEPHTQEHLLLGKGNVGRAVASLEDMSLATSTASTYQWYTTYQFHTAAGPDVFFKLFERQTDALLHPDYTDEEIRREVRNFGVTENPSDKTLRLEEKGTVYNEMVSSMNRPVSRLYYAVNQMLYGTSHPLSYSSGGLPSAIREMAPEHIRKFHRETHHLANMGMVASFAKDMPLADTLRRMDEILNRLEPNPEKRKFMSEAELPAPRMAQAGKIQIVDYPHKNEQQPGVVLFAWPAQLKLDTQEMVLLELFLSNFAGDATTNLYKKFVDTKTRDKSIEAEPKSVFAFVDDDLGNPVYLGLGDVAPAQMTEEKIAKMRAEIQKELTRVASFADGSPELSEFNTRLKNRITQNRRDLSKFINSPPGFGFRGTGNGWLAHVQRLNETDGFKKSVTMKPALGFVENLLAGDKNFWRGYLSKWKLTETIPYAGAARPSPEVIKRDEAERQARVDAELARLKTKYATTDSQETIKRYRDEYDRTTAELEKLEKQSGAAARFIESPPLTLDDQLDYKVSTLDPGGVQMVASTFDNMTSATTGLALRLDAVPENELVYLSLLPTLLRNVGVVRDGQPVSFEQMSELLRKEILNLNITFSTDFRTGRAELVARGAGNDAEESRRAVEWMRTILTSPDWRVENLPRIRDVVDQSLSGLRNRMQGSEESWVNDPANAYHVQNNPLLLTTSSFLTQAHNAHRLRWMLKDAGAGANRDAMANFLTKFAGAGAQSNRADLKILLGAMQGDKALAAKIPESLKTYGEEFTRLPAEIAPLAVEAAKDLDQLLSDIPDSSLAADWSYLARQIRHDLLTPPEKVLADLHALRQRLLKTGGARMFVVGSRTTQAKLAPDVRDLLGALQPGKVERAAHSNARLVESRLGARERNSGTPVFVGLVNPNTQGGVFLNSAPGVTYSDTSRDALLDFLASKLYAGGGAHGIFMKTWGAGLAYSNGLSGSPSTGRQSYYAERTPELPQTLRFVIEELKKAPRDPNLVEYAFAQALTGFRSASSYEARGEGMANDLADAITSEQVANFRRALLALRRDPKLADELYDRMGKVYARVLPGYGGAAKAKDVSGAVFYVIGPEKQLGLYEDYLKTVEGADTKLRRIYPRDYWITLKDAEASATGGGEVKAGAQN